MKIIFAGGGTGGHINPAISIANYIKSRESEFEALFIGTERGLEKKLVPAAGYRLEYIDIEGFDRKHLLKNIKVIQKLSAAKAKCVRLIKEFKPDYIVCTGGYVSGPVAMAAKKCGVPALIHEQNVYPGLTVKGAEKYVDCVAVSFEETVKHMTDSGKCIVTGNPVRPEILAADSVQARAELKIGEKPFVLIFGGSLGADRINRTVLEMLPRVLREQKFSLLFGTGDRNYEKIMDAVKEKQLALTQEVQIVPYIHNMHTVMAAADLVVSRSGAITVSEIAALGKASVLIPSPNVVRNHQEQNAREFEKNGGASVLTEAELSPDALYERILSLTGDAKARQTMEQNVRKLAQTEALERIYEVILKGVSQ